MVEMDAINKEGRLAIDLYEHFRSLRMTAKSVVATGTTVTIAISAALMRGIFCFISRTGSRGIRFRWDFLLTVAVFITQYPFTLPSIVSKPMNAVSMVGGRVRMECRRDSSNLPVEWQFAPADTNDTSYIYTDRQIPANLTSRYTIDTDGKTRYDIVIDSVDSSHAGTYICTAIEEGVSNATSASAQLVVLDSDPICDTNASASNGTFVDGDYLNLWCAVNYTGNWIPYMEWNKTGPGQRLTYTSETNRVTSSLTLPLYAGDDGVIIACKTSFNSNNCKPIRNPREVEALVDNVPDYEHVWTFKLSVLYAPRNLIIKPRKSVYTVGDRLECSANGNPYPSYEWMKVEAINGSALIIDDYSRSDKSYGLRCTAYNTVAGVRRQIVATITITVKGASSKTASTSLIAVVALGFAVVLLV